jgi:hypothetical protein
MVAVDIGTNAIIITINAISILKEFLPNILLELILTLP